MADYYGGQAVKEGFYMKRSSFEFEFVTRGGTGLPGDRQTHYLKVPLPVVMVAGPSSGLVYVISLPVVFFLTLGYLLTRRIGQTLKMTRR